MGRVEKTTNLKKLRSSDGGLIKVTLFKGKFEAKVEFPAR